MTDGDLPAGWAWTTLGEVTQVTMGQSPPGDSIRTAPDGVPFLQGKAEFGSRTPTFAKWTTQPIRLARSGDILLSVRAPVGAVNIAPEDCGIGRGLASLRASDAIDTRFLYHFAVASRPVLESQATGTTFAAIGGPTVRNHAVPLPPLPEQHRIVEVLEDHLSRLDAAEGALGSQLIRARNLLDRQLATAVNEAGGTSVRVAQVLLRKPANGRSVPTADVGFPVLRLTALRDGVIDLAERKIGEWSAADAEKFLVNRGDILMSRGNGSLRLVGRAGIVHAEPDPVAYPDTMIRLVPDVSQVLPEYLVTLWNSRTVRSQIESAARTTAGIYKINQSIVSNTLIPLPSLERQQQVVSEVGEVADAVRRLTTEIESTASRSAALRRSLLRAAFNGELVDQDPTDELANVALAKIRDQQSGTAPRHRRKAVAAKGPTPQLP